MCVIGSNAVIFGGLSGDLVNESVDSLENMASDDLYQLKLGSGHMEWSKLNITGVRPLPRWKHTATLYDNTQMVVIGGFHSSSHRLNDVSCCTQILINCI